MVLRPPQLLFQDEVVAEVPQLGDDEIDDLAHGVRVAAGVDGQRAAVVVGHHSAADGVGEPPPFADVLEEPRAHGPAEHDVQQVADIPIVVLLGVSVHPQADMALLDRLVAHGQPGHRRRRSDGDRLAVRRHVRERLRHQVPDGLVLDVAGRRDNQVPGGVDPREVVAQGGAVDGAHGGGDPENRPAQGVSRPEALSEELVHEIVGSVLHHLDLFEHDLLLARHLRGVERGAQEQIGQHVDGAGQMLVEHLDVVARALLRRESVEMAPDRVDLLRDVLRRPGRRALEEHVLDEVRDARVRRALVPRSAGQPDPEADRACAGHGLGQKTQPVVELLADNHG